MSVMLAAVAIFSVQGVPATIDLADARCVGALSMLGERSAEKDKADMQSTMFFYMGKIVGRSGSAALAPAMKAVVEELKAEGDAGLSAIVGQCATQMEQAVTGK